MSNNFTGLPFFKKTQKATGSDQSHWPRTLAMSAVLTLPLACSNLNGREGHQNAGPASTTELKIDFYDKSTPTEVKVDNAFLASLYLTEQPSDEVLPAEFNCTKGCPSTLRLGSNGAINWQPDSSDIGAYEMEFSAKHAESGRSAQVNFKLNVVSRPDLKIAKRLAFIGRDNFIITGSAAIKLKKAICLAGEKPVACPQVRESGHSLVMNPTASDPSSHMILRIGLGDPSFDYISNETFTFMEEAQADQGLQIGYSRDRTGNAGVPQELNVTCRGGDKVELSMSDASVGTLASAKSEIDSGSPASEDRFVRSAYAFTPSSAGDHKMVITCSKDGVTVQREIAVTTN